MRTCSVIGGGPSLKGKTVSELYGLADKTVGVNDVWRHVRVDVCVTIDTVKLAERFIGCPFPVIAAVPDNYGTKDATHKCDRMPKKASIDYRQRVARHGLSRDNSIVHSGYNSGFGALQVAYFDKPDIIVLFGIDYTNWKAHWFEQSFQWVVATEDVVKDRFAFFDSAAKQLRDDGIRVYNASPNSALDCFPKVTFEQGVRILIDAKEQI